jgi:ABC-type multidrug transport system fused ATPase/permease subunit
MPYGERTLPPRSGPASSSLHDVVYRPEGEEQPTIHGVTLEVEAGSTTALVGPTGSGKTTLTNLALRLVDAEAGTVCIDGVDARELARGEVPAVATLVAQQTFMFDDSVRGNVTLGEEATDESVWEALRIAQADGFVRAIPGGLDAVIGERGGTLSGGQRQRIALARAIWRRPRLLVLDDATSAVDPSVEQAILAGLREAREGMTVLVVAYRMATILLADQVVYIEHGRVVDRGTHAELIGRCTGYANLVQAYAREAAERAAVAATEEGRG